MPRLKILVITNWYPTKEEPSKAVWVREQTKAAGLFDDVLVLHCVEANRSQQSSWTIEPEADEEIRAGRGTVHESADDMFEHLGSLGSSDA